MKGLRFFWWLLNIMTKGRTRARKPCMNVQPDFKHLFKIHAKQEDVQVRQIPSFTET